MNQLLPITREITRNDAQPAVPDATPGRKVSRDMITLIEGDIPVHELPEQILDEVGACWDGTGSVEEKVLAEKWPESITLSQHNGDPAKFCITMTGEKLLAARYMFVNNTQFIVVKQKTGIGFYDGKASVVSFTSHAMKRCVAEGELIVQFWHTWENGAPRPAVDVVRLIGPKSSDDSSSSSASSILLPEKDQKGHCDPFEAVLESLAGQVARRNDMISRRSVQSQVLSAPRIPGHTSEEARLLAFRKRAREDDSEYHLSTHLQASRIPRNLPRLKPKNDGASFGNHTDGSTLGDHTSTENVELWRQQVLAAPMRPKGYDDSVITIETSTAWSALRARHNRLGNNDLNAEERRDLRSTVAGHPGVFFHFKKSLDHPDTRVCPLEIISSPVVFAQHASCAEALHRGSDLLSVRVGEIQRNIMLDYDPDYQWIMQTVEDLRLSSNQDVIFIITPGEW